MKLTIDHPVNLAGCGMSILKNGRSTTDLARHLDIVTTARLEVDRHSQRPERKLTHIANHPTCGERSSH